MSKSQNELLKEFMEKFTLTYNPEFFRTHSGDHFVTIREKDKPPRSIQIGKNSCIHFVILCMGQLSVTGGPHFSARVVDEFNSQVLRNNIVKDVQLRVGRDGEEVVIDRSDPNENSFIRIHKGKGFSIEKNCTIPFYQPPKQLALPVPLKIDLDLFPGMWKNLFNLENEDDQILILAFVIKSLIPGSGACPILIIEGLQGSGKSTASTILKKMIDPSKPLLTRPPINIEDLAASVKSTYLLCYDNLSGIKAAMADLFCTLSTGGGISMRQLYTRDDEVIFDLQRPVIFNGIDQLTARPDLVDRAIIIKLKPLDPLSRISELEFWDSFAKIYPSLLGGLYLLISKVLEVLPTVQSHSLPRMTEYARVGIAIEKVLNLKEGLFLQAFNKHIEEKNLNLFHSDLVCQAINEALDFEGYITGTPTEILKFVFKDYRRKGLSLSQIPTTAQAFNYHLGRKQEVLKANGITFGLLRRTKDKRIHFIKKSGIEIPPEDLEDFNIL